MTMTTTIFRGVRKVVKSDYLRHVCMYVHLPVRIEQLGFHWTYLYKI